MLPIYHVAYLVRDLARALPEFQAAFGGRVTEPVASEMLLRAPMIGPEPRRLRSRSGWVVGPPVPIEIWEAMPDSPWAMADEVAGPLLHHTSYWSDDLDADGVRLMAMGFALELTPAHDGDWLLGFAYFRNRDGTRVELQSAADKPSVDRWITHGTAKEIGWFRQVR